MYHNDAVKYLTPRIQLLDMISEPKYNNNKKKANNIVLRTIIHHIRLFKSIIMFIMNKTMMLFM